MKKSSDEERVIEANKVIHSLAVDKYRSSEPHFRPENISRIREIIKGIRAQTKGDKLVDIGCGTGFIIEIAKEFFTEIRGVDITPEMLEKVDTIDTKCDIKVYCARCDSMPFESEYFDVCTAHAVIHHLFSLAPTFEEIYRVLKKGGIFYSDLDPNAYFWSAMSGLDKAGKYSPVIMREIDAVLHKDVEIARDLGVDIDLVKCAEPLKHLKGGLKEEELKNELYTAGFSDVIIKYEWFLGEGDVIHDRSKQHCGPKMREYLQTILPLSRHLYKYLSIRARK